MIISTLLYVVSVAGPALLVAIAVDAFTKRRARALEAFAWVSASGALLLAVVYPSVLAKVGARVGVTVPVGVMGFVAIAGLFVAYISQRRHVSTLENAVRALEAAADAPVVEDSAAHRGGDRARE